MPNLQIDISIGEAADRLTILKIKLQKIKDAAKIANIIKEHDLLLKSISSYPDGDVLVSKDSLYKRLQETNKELWDVEDKLRNRERIKIFDKNFIELARSVYILNDKRAKIKKDINLKYKSELVEEKSYEKY